MQQSDLDDLADELFDPDLPNVVSVSFGGFEPFNGSLSLEHVETDEIVGIRSVLLCAKKKVETLSTDDAIEVDGTAYFARLIQTRGRSLAAIVLGK